MNLRRLALWLLLAFLFTIPFEDTIQLGGFGSFTRLLGIAAFGAGLLGLVRERGRALAFRPPSPYLVVAALFSLWGALSYYWTQDLAATLVRLRTFVQLMLMVWLMWEYLRSPREQRLAMQAWVLGAYLSVANALVIFWFGRDEGFRQVGFDPNDFSTLLALGVPMAWTLMLAAKRSWWRWLNALYLPVALLAVVLAASRGGLVMMLVALMIVPCTYGALRPLARLSMALLIALSALALFHYLPQLVPELSANIERLVGTASELRAGDWSLRFNIWRAGLALVERYPYLGVGFGAFPSAVAPIYGRPVAPHNVFLSIQAELGLIGLALFGLVLALVAWPLVEVGYHQRALHGILLAVLIVSFLPLGIEYRKWTWFTLTFLATLKPVALRGAALKPKPLGAARG